MKGISTLIRAKQFDETLVQQINEHLSQKGYTFIKGLDMNYADFQKNITKIIGQPIKYEGGTNNRENLDENILTPGTEPAHLDLAQHNEMSYLDQWPKYFSMMCVNAPPQGTGITCIADNVKVTQQMPKQIQDKMIKHGILYIRNFSNEENPRTKYFYNDWQSSFLTKDRKEVERQLTQAKSTFEWDSQGNLRTTYIKPSHLIHPDNGLELYFNASYANIYWWNDWEPFYSQNLMERPYYCQYGNGDTITDSELNQIHQTYKNNQMGENWEKGDILLLENHMASHGRTPYDPTKQRKIGVMMTTKVTRDDPFQQSGISTCKY